MQGGPPGSTEENPTDDGPEADAILAAPSPAAASLLSIRLFLFSKSNLPVSSQKLRSDGHLPAPSEAFLRRAGQAPGPAQGRTSRLAWGQSTSRTLSAT